MSTRVLSPDWGLGGGAAEGRRSSWPAGRGAMQSCSDPLVFRNVKFYLLTVLFWR